MQEIAQSPKSLLETRTQQIVILIYLRLRKQRVGKIRVVSMREELSEAVCPQNS